MSGAARSLLLFTPRQCHYWRHHLSMPKSNSIPLSSAGRITPRWCKTSLPATIFLPGKYAFDIYLNKKIASITGKSNLKKDTPNTPGYFCLDADSYRSYGVLVPDTAGSSACYDLVKKIFRAVA